MVDSMELLALRRALLLGGLLSACSSHDGTKASPLPDDFTKVACESGPLDELTVSLKAAGVALYKPGDGEGADWKEVAADGTPCARTYKCELVSSKDGSKSTLRRPAPRLTPEVLVVVYPGDKTKVASPEDLDALLLPLKDLPRARLWARYHLATSDCDAAEVRGLDGGFEIRARVSDGQGCLGTSLRTMRVSPDGTTTVVSSVDHQDDPGACE